MRGGIHVFFLQFKFWNIQLFLWILQYSYWLSGFCRKINLKIWHKKIHWWGCDPITHNNIHIYLSMCRDRRRSDWNRSSANDGENWIKMWNNMHLSTSYYDRFDTLCVAVVWRMWSQISYIQWDMPYSVLNSTQIRIIWNERQSKLHFLIAQSMREAFKN